MSLQDTILASVQEHGVTSLDIDRDAVVNGVDSIAVTIEARGGVRHEFTFAKSNHMSGEHIATVIKSYLRNRT